LPYRCAITVFPCVGRITEFRLNPNPSSVGEKINAIVTFAGNCGGRRVEIREGSCSGRLVCSCIFPLIPHEIFCFCSFDAPSVQGEYIYYACIDLDADGDFQDKGEYASAILKVVPQSTTTTLRRLPVPTLPPIPFPPPPRPSEYNLTLKRGWNLVSFPFKEYTLVSIPQSVYPMVYSYNSVEGTYEIFNLTTEYKKLRLRGFWVYSFEDNQRIVISGSEPFSSSEINLYANLSRADTPHQIAIPIKGIYLNSEKGSCEITRFYYWNSSDNTWYKWNATTGEYSRYNSEKKAYELIRVDRDPFIASGVSIFLYVRKNCTLGILPPPSPPS